jgi:SAM-dependent methyltransferase
LKLLFATTLLLSATLLFLVQPMVGKMILPLLGGAPAVWNTCMVFFQAALLAGYAYAHGSAARLESRRQALLHAGVLLLPALTLPLLTLPVRLARGESLPNLPGLSVFNSPPAEANPIPWLLALLVLTVGLPFFVLSTSAPLLQKWFAGTGHPSAGDPYFLYAASNLGSMLALISYPLLLEPFLRLEVQGRLWTAGYAGFVLLTLVCAAAFWRRSGVRSQESGVSHQAAMGQTPDRDRLTPGRRLRWVALAFVPSSLMLAVTTYMTTDVAAVPLLWVLPLALYLLSFILVFARRPLCPHWLAVRIMPLLIVPLAFVLLLLPSFHYIPYHLLTFFVIALVCHGELANDRPSPTHLTEFYLWLSIGGVLGGVFNGLIAPLVFNSIAEYPLALVLACLLLPGQRTADRGPGDSSRSSILDPRSTLFWIDLLLPVVLGGGVLGLALNVPRLGLDPTQAVTTALVFGPALLFCYAFKDRPLRFALGLGVLLWIGEWYNARATHVVYQERSFFGLLRVRRDPVGRFVLLLHGNINHGIQSLDDRRAALSYYHPEGPFGQAIEAFRERSSRPPGNRKVAVVGLGSGAMTAYAQKGEGWTAYELDPAVVRIAEDARFFTYLRDCPVRVQIVLGDGRLKLRAAPAGAFGLIVLDAFSSDAVPVHLLTCEALDEYLTRLAPGGLLVFNVSNKYLDLKPLLANLASHAGLVCFARLDMVSPEQVQAGRYPCQWVVMARAEEDLGPLVKDDRWQRLHGQPGGVLWTDDFSNLLRVIRWR